MKITRRYTGPNPEVAFAGRKEKLTL